MLKRVEPAPADKKEGAQTAPKWRKRARRGWRSPLTRRILAVNILALVVPVMGLLHLDQYRETLIASEVEALRIQGHAFALSLGSAAVETHSTGEEVLVPEAARRLMRVLFHDTGVRARAFSRAGELIADSFVLSGPVGGQVQVMELAPMELSPWPDIGGLYDLVVSWLPGKRDLPLYREERLQRAGDYSEVERALLGEGSGMVRRDRQGGLVLSVAVPVQRYRQVLGALMLSKDGRDIARAVDARRSDILMVFAVALAITVFLSIYLAGTIARPIRLLALSADRVRYGKGRDRAIPAFKHRNDEIGDLSAALREMTEALHARLDAIEGFAADVAHEIKNPLTSLRSAVETVTRLEDPAQQKRLMSIILDDVHRLDRLISDISDASRLDAELSRADMEAVDIGELLGTLVEVHEASTIIEGEEGCRFAVELPPGEGLVVPGLEGRLGQVLRNLLSNAITFSPPGGTIRLTAQRLSDQVRITVEDQGPGMPEGKLEAIFDRFYSERPKSEKFGTHSGLGLSISRQIVEAHGGSLRAENIPGPAGGVAGARFVILLPVSLDNYD